MDHDVHHPVAVAKVIVIPGNYLDKVVAEGNASPELKVEEGMSPLKSQGTTWCSV